jgi:hypothetical protein
MAAPNRGTHTPPWPPPRSDSSGPRGGPPAGRVGGPRPAPSIARDILIHEYFRVDLDLAWDMTQSDIPDLIAQIERILGNVDA